MFSLERFTMLDLSRFLPGPFASHVLADLGMNVIKVEETRPRYGMGRDGLTPPDLTPEEDAHYAAYNSLARNKKSVAIDLLDPALRPRSQEVFYKLVAQADVILEGYRPGAAAWMGIDYETVKQYQPSIIYCSMSGFGQDGPYADRPAHGGQFEAISGVTRQAPNQPPERYPVPLGDVSGALYAAVSIAAALMHREHTGQGSLIDVSLAASAMSLLVMDAAQVIRPDPPRSSTPGAGHGNRFLQCKDGRWISIGNSETVYWQNFCNVVGRPDWIPLLSRVDGVATQMVADMTEIFLTKSRDEWLKILTEGETCVAPVNDIAAALEDPQMKHVGMVMEMLHPTEGVVRQLGFPVRVSGESVQKGFAPTLGRDTRETLRGIGYSEDELVELEQAGIVRSSELAPG
jgi:crotonobetainyl-CoA:carnitine CoA-transferase CaiB-like acyl-CoA transferase